MKNSNMYFKIFISILVIIYGYGIMDVNENYQILINRVYKNSLINVYLILVIDICLILFSVYEWVIYIKEFKPENAFCKIVRPTCATFLAFQWFEILRWVELV